MTVDAPPNLDHAFLAGGGTMGARMRAHDWGSTPLGPLEKWPQSLRSAISIMLNSRYPIALYWGPELALLYNDAWSPIPGGKHPWALGRPGREVWPEIWETIGPLYERVFETGEGVWQEDELLPMNRHGYVEECYYNFTFSPVRGEDGRIDGIFNAVVETTDRVLSERRLKTLSRMGERADASLSVEGACRWSAAILGDNRADVPFALIYLRHGDQARLVAATGIDAGSPGAPPLVDLASDAAAWPLVNTGSGPAHIVPARPDAALPAGLWPEPIAEVVLAPIILAGETRPGAYLLAGANPRRRVDESYRSFFDLAAGHVATAISTARAYEEERHRAEALAEIDRAKTQFFSNVSHEFRTPLTLMLGPLDDLHETASAEQRDLIGMVQRNAERLLRLVNALLDFSRIEAGRVEARFQPTDLSAFTADLASAFRAATEKAGLRLIVDTPTLPQPVLVDRGMWETIVLNLLSNAFKFTLAGEIRVEVREQDEAAELTVSDTGIGIPAAELPRLFERFHRVEGTEGRSFEGTGIGLALVQELVKQHGGAIRVESQEGRGARFSVTVPLGAAHLPAERVDLEADVDPVVTRAESFVGEALRWLPEPGDAQLDLTNSPLRPDAMPSNAGARVLVADDNADLRSYIARLLTERGYQVEVTADGGAALEAVRARRPDVVVTDVMMPTLDGFGLLAAIRGDESFRDLPVIMLSAHASDDAMIEGLGAGADDYLVKPFSARELLARVGSSLALARVRREAAEVLRASEARLRESEEQLRLATEAAEVGLWDVDEVNGRLFWPPRVKAMFGISLDRAVSMDDFYKGLHPYDREAISAAYAAAADPNRRALYDVEYRTVGLEDGVIRWVAAKGRGVFDNHGHCLRVIGTAIDITRRKQAEERLHELNEQLERRVAEAIAGRKVLADVVDGTDIYVQVADLNFNWLAINKAASAEFARIFGVSPPRVGDNMLAKLESQPEHQAAVRQVWSRALRGEEFVETDEFGDPALDRRYYEMRFRSLRGANGRLTGACQFAADVTERLREQHRLREAEAALAQALKMEAVGQLTGGIAHDFNNLLQGVAGSLDLIRRKPGDRERVQRWAEAGFKAAERGAKLTGQLLAFSRAQKIELKPVALTELVTAFREMVDRTIGAHIKVTLDLKTDGINVLGDEVQIEMAVLNLSLNARDAMPDGGELTISTRPVRIREDKELTDGEYVELAVRDTGTGMPPTVIARAFDPFFTTKGLGKGTGLGLSQVYGAIRQAGGTVRIDSRTGNGTTVRLLLRRTDDLDTSSTPASEAVGRSSFSARILVIDDDPDVRAFLVESLDALGFTVVEAQDGTAGIAEIERSGPDLVILDFAMPGLNGAEVAKRVLERCPGLPIIFATGFADSAMLADVAQSELPILRKPFGIDELQQVLHVALQSNGMASSAIGGSS